MQDYKIKELTKDDLNNDFKGFFTTLGNMKAVGNISLDKAKDILKKINLIDGHIFVAINNKNKIIGTGTVLIEPKFISEGGIAAHIEDFATNKKYERNGIGRSIIKEIINYSKKRNCYKIILDCSEDNVNFYNKFGFEIKEHCMKLYIK
jgi:glucosamine-phosphate N-acetyltransferase